MTTEEFVELLEGFVACEEAVKWVKKQKNPYTAWRTCQHGAWMCWLLNELYGQSSLNDGDYKSYKKKIGDIYDEWRYLGCGSEQEKQVEIEWAKLSRKIMPWDVVKRALEEQKREHDKVWNTTHRSADSTRSL